MSNEKRKKDMCDSSSSDSLSETESDSNETSKQNQNESLRKNSGAAKYNTKYNPSWAKIYPVKAVPNDRHSCFCIPCGKKIRCGHQGLRDIKIQ